MLSTPNSWDIQPNVVDIPKLGPGEKKTVSGHITVPIEVTSGNYTVKAIASTAKGSVIVKQNIQVQSAVEITSTSAHPTSILEEGGVTTVEVQLQNNRSHATRVN